LWLPFTVSLFLFGAIITLFTLMGFVHFHIIVCDTMDFGASVHRLGDIYLFTLQCRSALQLCMQLLVGLL
jgi:hypothetical protein